MATKTKSKKNERRRKRNALGAPHPFRIYRTNRLADLFSVDESTIWRWRRDGILPEFTKIGGIEGLTGDQVADLLKVRKPDTEESTS